MRTPLPFCWRRGCDLHVAAKSVIEFVANGHPGIPETRSGPGAMSKADAAPTPKQAPASGSPVPSPDGGDGNSKAAGKASLARPKSFADTLAGRPERSLAERYNIEPSIPEDVIEWTVSRPRHPLPCCIPARRR